MKEYEEPKVEVVTFEEDIITSSNGVEPIQTHNGGSND